MQRFIALYASFGITLGYVFEDGVNGQGYGIDLEENVDLCGAGSKGSYSTVVFDKNQRFLNQAFYDKDSEDE